MTVRKQPKFGAARKRLREIEDLLEPYKKVETAKPFSSRGKWKSSEATVAEQADKNKDFATYTN